MSEKAKRPVEFDPVANPKEAKKFLGDAVKMWVPVMIWTKDQEQVINSRIHSLHEKDNLIYISTPRNFAPETLINTLAKVGSPDCYFSISLLEANLFFKSKFKHYDRVGLKFSFPDQLYKVQRRKDYRHKIQDTENLAVTFIDPRTIGLQTTKKIVDISAGGISIFLDSNDDLKLSTGTELKELRFKVKDKDIVTLGVVRNQRPYTLYTGEKGVRIGIAFKTIRAGDAQTIAGFVFEESRKAFARFL